MRFLFQWHRAVWQYQADFQLEHGLRGAPEWAGSWTYAAQAGGLGNDYPTAVLLDGSRLLVTGTFGPASTAFGSLTLTTPANTAGFIAGLGGIPVPASAPPLASLGLAPNPASTSTRLTLPGSSAAARTVLVLDALGREVHRQEVPANTSTLYLPLAGLSRGLYVVRCGEATGRLLVE